MYNNKFKSALLKNSTVGFISQLLNFLFTLVTRNIFIKYIGVELLGLNSTLASVLGMLSLAELGFQSAIVFNLYKPLHDGNQKEVNSIMNILKIIYRGVGLFFIITTILLTPFLKVIITGIDVTNEVVCYFWLQSLASVCSYFLAYKRAILYADQKDYISKIIDLLCSVVFNTAQCISLIVLQSYVIYLLLKVMQTFVSNVIIHCYCSRNYSYLKNTKLNKEKLKKIMRDVRDIFASKIAGFIYGSTDNLVISAFVSTVSVGLLVNYTTITTSLKTLINSALSPIIPSLGNHLLDENDNQRREKLFLLNAFIRYLIALVVVIPTGVLIDDFIIFWAGSNMLLNGSIVILLCIDFYIHLVHSVTCDFISSAGLFNSDKYVEMFGAGCNIVTSLILVNYFGIAGVLLGTVVSQMVFWVGRSYIVYKECLNLGKKEYLKYWLKNIVQGIVAAGIAIIVFLIYKKLPIEIVLVRFVVGGIVSEAVIFALIIVLFRRNAKFKLLVKMYEDNK